MILPKSRYLTESAAREAARTLGDLDCQIIETRDVTKNETKTATGKTTEWVRGNELVYYVEHGDGIGMIRYWENLVFEGKGKNA